MNIILLKSLVWLVVVSILFFWSLVLFLRVKTISSYLQLTGSFFLLIVGLVHVFEAMQVFPFMHWGYPNSAGHYLDLSSAILGFTLFPMGFFLRLLARYRS